MESKTTEAELWHKIGFIKISSIRYTIIKTLDTDFLMPSEIVKETGLKPSQVSGALHDLKKENLVKCMNEKTKKGRIYQNTKLALKILEVLDG